VPAIAVTGLTIYTGDRFPQEAQPSSAGRRGRGSAQRQPVGLPNEKWEEIRRGAARAEAAHPRRAAGPDGLLYVLTGESTGAVLRLEPIEATTTR
jgi:glucose/arabinose dehydrogenase